MKRFETLYPIFIHPCSKLWKFFWVQVKIIKSKMVCFFCPWWILWVHQGTDPRIQVEEETFDSPPEATGLRLKWCVCLYMITIDYIHLNLNRLQILSPFWHFSLSFVVPKKEQLGDHWDTPRWGLWFLAQVASMRRGYEVVDLLSRETLESRKNPGNEMVWNFLSKENHGFEGIACLDKPKYQILVFFCRTSHPIKYHEWNTFVKIPAKISYDVHKIHPKHFWAQKNLICIPLCLSMSIYVYLCPHYG